MRRMLMLSAALLVSISAASMATTPCVGLFSDESHSYCAVWPNPLAIFEAWLWWLPGSDGIMGVEFALDCPSDVFLISITYHPELESLVMDCCGGLWCNCFYSTCHTDWVYVIRLEFVVLSTAPHYIDIVPYPPSGGINAATCEPGYPFVPAGVFHGLIINDDNVWCYVAAEESSWGAIKGLYR